MVFLEHSPQGYSIFARPDDQLVQTGYGTETFHWFRPEQPIQLDHLVVANASDVDLRAYDEAFLWNSSTKEFRRIPIPAR